MQHIRATRSSNAKAWKMVAGNFVIKIKKQANSLSQTRMVSAHTFTTHFYSYVIAGDCYGESKAI